MDFSPHLPHVRSTGQGNVFSDVCLSVHRRASFPDLVGAFLPKPRRMGGGGTLPKV